MKVCYANDLENVCYKRNTQVNVGTVLYLGELREKNGFKRGEGGSQKNEGKERFTI